MVSNEQRKLLHDLVGKTKGDRATVRRLVARGRAADAEPETERFRAFAARRTEGVALRGAEAIQGPTIDLQPVRFLEEGATARRAVCLVEVSTPLETTVGSGFLISPTLLITNQHVIRDAAAASAARVTFDFEVDARGVRREESVYRLAPERCALFSAESDLDYALVALGPCVSGCSEPRTFGCLPLSNTPDRHVIGMAVNVIQHPDGRPKMITVRNNLLTHRTDRTLLYEADTRPASSGAVVTNDDWQVVALHHWGEPFLERMDEAGQPIPSTVNEGIRISAIYADLVKRVPTLPEAIRALVEEALSLETRGAPASGGRQLSGPRPSGPESLQRAVSMQVPGPVPFEVTIRFGAPPQPETTPPLGVRLVRGAEAVHIDRDYTNRDGYDPNFIPSIRIDLPEANGVVAKRVAPLRATEPKAEGGELKYQHFSVKLDKKHRMALFTATNIDGPTYLEVDRATGEVRGSEADSWFSDDRVSEAFYLGKSFYKDWSTYFDRGHLTRRTDPTWGTVDEAERANADTFHLTNCSPQHFRFNQTTKYWQGAERYVLENGLLTRESKGRISVFQGPLFDDAVDMWADDVQIPSTFFKVIVWRTETGLRSVALIVDQLPLLTEERKNLGTPRDVASVNVSEWRTSIAEVEQRSGLSFGDSIRKADTVSRTDQPMPGGEARRLLRSLKDLLA